MINRFLIVYSFLLFDFLYGYKVAKYVAREYLNSCEFSCEYHDYFCSDEMMMNMDCRLSAMSYCNTYLNYDTNGEISSQEFGCIVNCEKLLYFENYRLGVARNCKTDGKKTKELFRRPILDNTVPICECYVTEEKPKLSVPYRVKIGLYLFFFFLGGYIFVKLCTGSSGKKSYIR